MTVLSSGQRRMPIAVVAIWKLLGWLGEATDVAV